MSLDRINSFLPWLLGGIAVWMLIFAAGWLAYCAYMRRKYQ